MNSLYRHQKFLACLLVLVFASTAWGEDAACNKALTAPTDQPIAKSSSEELSQTVATQAEKAIASVGSNKQSKRGYAVLVGTMVGSAALATYLSTHLPAELQFTSIFIAQISTLGVYILGAPIWEPISSKFRQWAFGISTENSHVANSPQQLESTWIRTQENYSLNAQMSRNLISQFILSIKDNFYQAYRAHTENNPIYSADQVAEAAYRMRRLFKDVSPTDESVAIAVQSAFTNHILVDEAYVQLVWQRIESLDANAKNPEVAKYYQAVLQAWL